MGLSKRPKTSTTEQFCFDIDNELLYVDGVTYEPTEVTTIVGTKHFYVSVPEATKEELKHPSRIANFLMYAEANNIRSYYRPNLMDVDSSVVFEVTDKKYCVVIQ